MSGITSAEIPQLCTRLEKAMEEAKKKKKFSGEYGIELTEWRAERPFLNLDFVSEFEGRRQSDEEVDNQCTENSMIEPLLTAFLGGQTDFIVAHNLPVGSTERTISINANADPVNKEFSLKCISLAVYYSSLAKFVEDNYFISQGRVNAALASGIDTILHDYQSFIIAVEKAHRKRKLTLHELWYQIQDISETLRVLVDLTNKINESEARGAATLTILHEFTSHLTISNLEKKICIALTSEAAVSFMESVQKWVFNGEIYDPYDEFMVMEYFTSKDEWKKVEYYWEKKYQIRKTRVPSFLQHLEIQILNSGKYLNVIKECVSSERDFKLAPIKELVYQSNELDLGYASVINEAYIHASKHLLSYMLKEYKIKERIISLKRYFLLEQGDFVVQLLDTCDGELSKETSDILPSRLTTLVEMAIRIPSTNDDNYRDEIRMSLQKLTLSEQVNKILSEKSDEIEIQNTEKYEMTGYESFTLHIDCKWPISLVLHSKVLSSYQMLFRHLFYCKYIERMLCRVWLLNQPIRGLPFLESRTYSSAHALRYKMMIFLENVEYYMMEVAIETHWMEFMQYFDNAPNIDDLIAEHWNFLDRSLKDCLLGDYELFRIFREILSCCLEFGTFTIGIKSLTETEKYPTFSQRIDQLTNEFETNLSKFYIALQETSSNDTSSKLIKLFFRLKPFFQKDED
ncbi:gamma-tubulin complex component 2-like isoform X2 [Cimex lectularius]|uniref:Gamma-tubulin complex component n=1 Tax=Cimex lectularius TaxID=79782 RepID=A0A8I6S659_CIMLE|nr:gamma-tubulin complex component 2-like isoform X2 [Cimex lectularius]